MNGCGTEIGFGADFGERSVRIGSGTKFGCGCGANFGERFGARLRYWLGFRRAPPSALPAVVILENVKELLSPDLDTNSITDVDYIIQRLVILGYSIVFYVLNKAEQHMSPAVRWRLYFIALRVPKCIENRIPEIIAIKQQMLDLMLQMRTQAGKPTDFLVLSDDNNEGSDDDNVSKPKQPKVMTYKDADPSMGP